MYWNPCDLAHSGRINSSSGRATILGFILAGRLWVVGFLFFQGSGRTRVQAVILFPIPQLAFAGNDSKRVKESSKGGMKKYARNHERRNSWRTRVILNFFFCAWRTPGVRSCAPHVRLMCARLGADGYLRFSLVS